MSAPETERRRASIPEISCPAELPISERHSDLVAAIAAHPVVIVSGETGSGKSTQLPKLCLEAGLGATGWIGHTQPRRLAARTIAERVAHELGTPLGGLVGYAVRFDDQTGPDTIVKTMTDGILLAEIARDAELSRYEAIIVDEAHERTLNIDFLLGILRRLIDGERSDLKLIVTSATIDTARFAAYFDDAPVIEVSGRSHPIEIRWRPLDGDPADPGDTTAGRPGGDQADQTAGIEAAVREMLRDQPGDVLVFCSGEREIRDTVEQLQATLRDTEVLPLFARLSPAEQQRVFAAHDRRRVVVATNVAETSLTVPGIASVVDAGTARISRFNRRTKVQRLPIEAISRASADQRAGRCGRLGPGVCIRLYSEDDYLSRPEFTDPEIRRTSLASVILAMAALGLGDPLQFPFIDAPQPSAVRDGIRLLEELDAVNPRHEGTRLWLTPLGAQLAELGIDLRLARMLLAAEDHGCVRELLVIASGLAIQDPRIRPSAAEGSDARQTAEALHARFAGDDSDFMSYLRLWDYIARRRAELSGNGFRRMCRDELLHWLRIREWQDLHAQLSREARRMGLSVNDNQAPPEAVHQAVLAGLLTHVGVFDARRGDYRGTRSGRFTVASGSALAERRPRWLMAAEMVETERVLARVCAPIDPGWLEAAASHLLRWEYSAPWWDRRQGAALCSERASLYGLGVIDERTIQLQRIDPGLARHLLIRHGIVEGDSDRDFAFAQHNRASLAEVAALQTRLRRDDLLIGEEELIARYEAVIADSVVSERHLERWLRDGDDPSLLCFGPAELTAGEVPDDHGVTHPVLWPLGDRRLAISYRFEPGAVDDGITIEIPLSLVGQLDASRFEWLVPGYRRALVEALLRSLPKSVRRRVVPVADTAGTVLAALDPADGEPLEVKLAEAVARIAGTEVSPAMFDRSTLPPWLRPHYRVMDHNNPLAEDDDLVVLQGWFAQQARELLSSAAGELERSGLRAFPDDDIPQVVVRRGLGQTVRFYPALVDEGDSVALRLLAGEAEQAEAMWLGIRRLLLLGRPALGGVLRELLSDRVKAAIVTSPYADPAAWLDDCLAAAADAAIAGHDGPLSSRDSHLELLESFRAELPETLHRLAGLSVEALVHARRLRRRLDDTGAAALAFSVADLGEQLQRLVYDGFVSAVGTERLADVCRYLRAACVRAESLADKGARDRDRSVVIRAIEAEHESLAEALGLTPELEDLAWQIQELRVSLFAQSVGASGPVSAKRIRADLQRISLAAQSPGTGSPGAVVHDLR